ncbi:biotin/lipoyl-binding protein [Neopusillimonas aromaticivorans]|uniref:biotin/lipoyl-binding protein n=1 Tax=Neopusillimonas aromaticivorans TaxID=2979868 RepID=UPI002593ED9B|nr:biotin/lipoyl-binding protein [Neopusillimonas aromaticivorans]WJJ94281.1 biotin/lipoyl-binding protein [Neopusillimonas aromaticivorans]
MPHDPNTTQRHLARWLAIIVIALTLAAGLAWWRYLDTNRLSEDAIIEADIVHISTPVPGKIVELHVREGDRVARGEPLYQLEKRVYELRVEQARAELAVANAALSTRERQIRAETANATIADEQIKRAQANLELARSTQQRLEPWPAKATLPNKTLIQHEPPCAMQRSA